MAYQPIQLPSNMGVGAGLRDLTESVGDLSNFLQQQKARKLEQVRFDEEKKRQAQFDFQQAYQTAANLAEKGDIAGAQAMLAPYGATLQDLDAEAAGLKKEMGIGAGPQRPLTSNFYADQQQPAQGGSAVPDARDGGRSMAAPGDTTEADAAFMGIQAPQPVQPPPMQGPDVSQLMQQATGGAPAQDPLNPILAGFGKDRERQQAMARRMIAMTDPSGRQVQLDPDARRNFAQQQQEQERERLATVAEKTFPGDYGKQTALLIHLTGDAKTAATIVSHSMEAANKARAEAEAKVGDRAYEAAENDRRSKRDAEEAAAQARLNASLGIGKTTIVQPGAEASGAGQVLTGIRSDLKEWTDRSGYERVAKELSSSGRALQAINSGNPKLVQQAIFAYGKETAGVGSFTRDEQNAIINKTGGTWEQVKNQIQQALDGDYSGNTIDVFRKAMEVKAQSAKGELGQIHGAYQNKFRQGTAYQNVQENMFDEERELFGRYGLPVTPPGAGAGGVSYATPSMVKRGGVGSTPSTGPKETREERKKRLRADAAKMKQESR